MTVTINGSGTITGVTTMGTTVVNQTLTTPTITSTMGVGNATPASSGAGITFPASQNASSDANTLDDYEEGTWTPSFGANGSASTCTYNYRLGTYTKIGRVVTACIDIGASSTLTGSTGSLQILSLPFPVASVSNLQGGVGAVGYYSGWTISVPSVSLYLDGGQSYVNVVYGGGTAVGYMGTSNVQNGTRFSAVIQYETN